MQYIFSYGTLIHPQVRALTGVSGNSYPAKLIGFTLNWCVPILSERRSALGVIEDPSATCVGLVIEITDNEIEKFDRQEKEYSRQEVEVELTDVDVNQKAWVYIPRQPIKCTEAYPVAQTYIDAVIAGCLLVSDEFTKQYISSVSNWDVPIVDDRLAPRYSHALSDLPVKKINLLLPY